MSGRNKEYERLTFDELAAIIGQGVLNLDGGFPIHPDSHVHNALNELVERVARYRVIEHNVKARGKRARCRTCGTTTPIHFVGIVLVDKDGRRSWAEQVTRVLTFDKGRRCIRYKGKLYELNDDSGAGEHTVTIPRGCV